MTKIGVVAFHIIIAALCGLFMGWAVYVDGPVATFTFWAGALMGALFYIIFLICTLILLQTFGDRDE